VCSVAANDERPRTLVIGLGNPILGDDGVGWRVAEEVEHRLAADPELGRTVGRVEVDLLAVGGLALMERLVGYEHAVLIDAVLDGRPPGTIAVGTLAEMDGRLTGHLDSAHDATLSAALEVGVALGARLPASLSLVTVSARRVGEFAERMSREVAAAVASAADEVVALMARPVEVVA
jgi:hydrogenase maturation protease